MKPLITFLAAVSLVILVACSSNVFRDISGNAAGSTTRANLENMEVVDGVLTNLTARATGGGVPFDGQVNELSDLDDLVTTAWGESQFGLHRGHAPIESVLEAFLGISHDRMHEYMENDGLNLARICDELELDTDKLIQSLTNSFEPYIDQGVSNGVITADQKQEWLDKVKEEFTNRVYWNG